MFSYFQNGIVNVIPKENLQFDDLLEIIKNNPQQQQLIEKIRGLRLDKNDYYKVLKRRLSYITPNCMVKYRDLSEGRFGTNFIGGSKYIYFDIDDIPDIGHYKAEFIYNYGNLASLICKSSSGEGLSVLFRLGNEIKCKREFLQAWNYIRFRILKEVKVDESCKDLGRSMFISFDPDLYFNPSNKI